jgi:hypothetical protein
MKDEIPVERDRGPAAQGAVSFHTTRWTIVMTAAESQAPGGESAFRPVVPHLLLSTLDVCLD